MDRLNSLVDAWQTEDTLVVLILVLSSLVVLYAIALIHQKLRSIEADISAMRKEQSVISDELEIIVSMAKDKAEKAKQA
jgi:hypothetical protein